MYQVYADLGAHFIKLRESKKIPLRLLVVGRDPYNDADLGHTEQSDEDQFSHYTSLAGLKSSFRMPRESGFHV